MRRVRRVGGGLRRVDGMGGQRDWDLWEQRGRVWSKGCLGRGDEAVIEVMNECTYERKKDTTT